MISKDDVLKAIKKPMKQYYDEMTTVLGNWQPLERAAEKLLEGKEVTDDELSKIQETNTEPELETEVTEEKEEVAVEEEVVEEKDWWFYWGPTVYFLWFIFIFAVCRVVYLGGIVAKG